MPSEHDFLHHGERPGFLLCLPAVGFGDIVLAGHQEIGVMAGNAVEGNGYGLITQLVVIGIPEHPVFSERWLFGAETGGTQPFKLVFERLEAV